MSRTGWKVVAVAGALLTLSPIVGALVTAFGLTLSFRAVEYADPAEKATRLADGISMSMWATAIGLAVFPIGAIVFGIALWQLVRKRDATP